MRKILLFSILGLFGMQAISQEIPEYLLENETVHRYLTEVQYDPNDYSYSRIMEYCYSYPWDWEGEGQGVRLDFPKPVTLQLTSALPAAGKLYVAESEDYGDADLLVMDIEQGAQTIDVYNLIPGRTYNWKLEYDNAGVMTVAQSGKFKTTGQLRMLKIDNVFNVRDMGGWAGLGGHPMKYGQIIRGSRLNVNKSSTKMITAAGDKELVRVGLRSELDMRDATHSVNAKYAFFGTNYPILNVNSAYNSRIATFANGPQSIQGINQLIAWLKEGKPVYLHCSVGADRTGTVAYLVGAVCGMSEDALCKEFELTSFSGDKIDNEAVSNAGSDLKRKYERLIRQRDMTGRLDPNDNNESYKFAKMVAAIKANYEGGTLQRKVYNHLKGGVNGTKVTEEDLKWLIKFMVDYDLADAISSVNWSFNSKGKAKTIEFKAGETRDLQVVVSPANHSGQVVYTSSNPAVATVSADGIVKAVRGGTANITIEIDGISQTLPLKVETVESKLPVSTYYNGNLYFIKDENKIKNGSFEYGGGYTNWKNAKGTDMSDAGFYLRNYPGTGSMYIESKLDGDDASEGSIRMKWGLAPNKAYAFGYRVKNSTSQKNEANANLKAMAIDYETEDKTDAKVFEAPTYAGEWTEIQSVFYSDAAHDAVMIEFTHLSNDSNNTCFDNFYVAEIDTVTGVRNIILPATQGQTYDLNGRAVQDNTNGILIRDGKKFYNK
ncbi:MAG: tyrosine-protein phosphatase [Bacteroidaceae bacterium]|nr:tyrosine-protein phosphatase [Bacteroidaceae bacterium]